MKKQRPGGGLRATQSLQGVFPATGGWGMARWHPLITHLWPRQLRQLLSWGPQGCSRPQSRSPKESVGKGGRGHLLQSRHQPPTCHKRVRSCSLWKPGPAPSRNHQPPGGRAPPASLGPPVCILGGGSHSPFPQALGLQSQASPPPRAAWAYRGPSTLRGVPRW